MVAALLRVRPGTFPTVLSTPDAAALSSLVAFAAREPANLPFFTQSTRDFTSISAFALVKWMY
jgi:hypothetical protein